MGILFSPKLLPISGYVGMNGSGKTALSVRDALKQSNGKTLYTSTPINPPDWWDGQVVNITSLTEVMDYRDGHVFLDEISMILPARGTNSLPPELVLLMKSLRHSGLTLSWTAPSMEDCDVQIRRVTQCATAIKAVIVKRKKDDPWGQTLWSYAKQYDLRAYGDLKPQETTPLIASGFLRLASLPLGCYDTHAPVSLVADHMVCSVCGGAKRKQQCSCKASAVEHAVAHAHPDGRHAAGQQTPQGDGEPGQSRVVVRLPESLAPTADTAVPEVV